MNINVNGYKTYISSVGLIMWAVGGFAAGKLDANTAMQSIMIALGMMGIRHGVEKNKAVT